MHVIGVLIGGQTYRGHDTWDATYIEGAQFYLPFFKLTDKFLMKWKSIIGFF